VSLSGLRCTSLWRSVAGALFAERFSGVTTAIGPPLLHPVGKALPFTLSSLSYLRVRSNRHFFHNITGFCSRSGDDGGQLQARGPQSMNDVTRILSAIEGGDPTAAEQLLPLVYDELRKLAAQKLTLQKPGQTLQPTALVHEAYLRLVDVEKVQHWNSRGHFFSAAADAMRRILVERARRKRRQKHGGDRVRADLLDADPIVHTPPHEILAVNETLDRLAAEDGQAAELVKLRYFGGLSVEEAAQALGLSLATAYRHWTYARAWVRCEILGQSDPAEE
jgi:RNA polymerase sigma factor (TIGR02999 family)